MQYHPTGLPGTGILITEASRGEGGYLINSEGERFLATRDYGVGTKAELGPRDMISRAIILEIEAGRGIDVPGKLGEYANLDLRHIGEEKLETRLPFVRELARTYAGTDPVTQPIPIRPVLHYMMGGVDVNIDGETIIGGLYAAGETACVSLNGANRLGSNSLTECLVFGARSGQHAVARAKGGMSQADAPLLEQAEERSRAARSAARTQARRRDALGHPPGHERRDGDGPRRVSRAGIDGRGGSRHRGAEAALRAGEPRATPARCSTRSSPRRSSSRTCSTARRRLRPPRHSARNRAAPTRGATSRSATTSAFLHHSLVYYGANGPRFATKPVTLGVLGARGAEVLRSAAERSAAGSRTEIRRNGSGEEDADRHALRSGPGPGAAHAELRDPRRGGLEGPRRAELHQRRSRPDALAPLVVPHGGVRQLRDDGERRAEAHLQGSRLATTATRSRWRRSRTSRWSAISSIEIDGFMEKLKAVKPWIMRRQGASRSKPGPRASRPTQLDEFKQFSMCINCMLCYAACPVVANEPDFLGPAAIALGHRYNLDSRDEGAGERNEIFRGDGAVFSCSYANECSEVCPKHVDPVGGDAAGEAQRRARLGDELRRAARREVSEPCTPAPRRHAARSPRRARAPPIRARPTSSRSAGNLRPVYAVRSCRRVYLLLDRVDRCRVRVGARRRPKRSTTHACRASTAALIQAYFCGRADRLRSASRCASSGSSRRRSRRASAR